MAFPFDAWNICNVLPLTFFFMQKPLGLLSLLDEESTFPNGTDLTFANKLKQHLNSNSCFRGERGKAFSVCHYAGEVFTLVLIIFTSFSPLMLHPKCLSGR